MLTLAKCSNPTAHPKERAALKVILSDRSAITKIKLIVFRFALPHGIAVSSAEYQKNAQKHAFQRTSDRIDNVAFHIQV